MDKTFSVAPMMDMTDRHCRAFLRLLSPRFRLYTEMVVVGSIIHGDRERFLGFDPSEHPLALQLGGCDPEKLALCAELGETWGYDEINLNVGCPSDRVKNARFGAALMAEPELVGRCVEAMKNRVSIPVTVKTRLGIDDLDSYEYFDRFVGIVSDHGCRDFIVHARKAWLKGLSPKENRTVPPLHYDRVFRLKQERPDLNIAINGGIVSCGDVESLLPHVDGVMIGREAYQNPWCLRELDARFLCGTDDTKAINSLPASRIDVVQQYLPYVEDKLSQGIYLRHMTRHMLGLFHGQPGAKGWRRYLSEHGPRKEAGLEVILRALEYVNGEQQAAA